MAKKETRLGQLLKKYRALEGVTQERLEELTEELGHRVSASMIAHVETGRRTLSLESLGAVNRALGLGKSEIEDMLIARAADVASTKPDEAAQLIIMTAFSRTLKPGVPVTEEDARAFLEQFKAELVDRHGPDLEAQKTGFAAAAKERSKKTPGKKAAPVKRSQRQARPTKRTEG